MNSVENMFKTATFLLFFIQNQNMVFWGEVGYLGFSTPALKYDKGHVIMVVVKKLKGLIMAMKISTNLICQKGVVILVEMIIR